MIDNGSQQGLQELLEQNGIVPGDMTVYEIAMTHSSYLNEHELPTWEGNERLEFLGDSVIGLVVTETLYRMYPEEREGTLSKIKSVAVSRTTLAECASKIGLGDHLRLGVGETKAGGKKRQSILAAVFESFVGAIYLDQGIEAARGFIVRHLKPVIEQIGTGDRAQDHKSKLQELAQRVAGYIPRYSVVQSEGPDHDKWFAVQVTLHGRVIGYGEGTSKKKAEQNAAKQALDRVAEEGESILQDGKIEKSGRSAEASRQAET